MRYAHLPDQLGIALWNMDPELPRVTTPDEVMDYSSLHSRFRYKNSVTRCVIKTILKLQENLPWARFLQLIEDQHRLKASHWRRLLIDKLSMENVGISLIDDSASENVRILHDVAKIFHHQKTKLDVWLARQMRRWYVRTVLPRKKTGQVVARKEGKEDRIYGVHYDEKKHPFWASAFSSLFGGKDEEGRVIMRVEEIGTSQEAIGAYCEHLRDPKTHVMDYVFYEAERGGGGRGSEMLEQMAVIGRLWDNPVFADRAESILEEYIEHTLYRTDIGKDQRLALFLERDILKARAAWEGVFDTSEKRLALAVQLKMPDTRHSAFRRCETIDQLVAYLDMLRGRKKNPMDRVPQHLIDRQDRATDVYHNAVRGTRVGMMGWYWNSEEIEIAARKLETVKREINTWLLRHPQSQQHQQHQKPRSRLSLCVA